MFLKPCSYEGCKVKLECFRSTKKYCPPHQRIMRNLATQRSYAKRRAKELKNRVGFKCRQCKVLLDSNRTKFCSRKCYDKFDNAQDKKIRKIQTSIKNHYEYIKVLELKVRMIKKGVIVQ